MCIVTTTVGFLADDVLSRSQDDFPSDRDSVALRLTIWESATEQAWHLVEVSVLELVFSLAWGSVTERASSTALVSAWQLASAGGPLGFCPRLAEHLQRQARSVVSSLTHRCSL
jgi:hypothetical protein